MTASSIAMAQPIVRAPSKRLRKIKATLIFMAPLIVLLLLWELAVVLGLMDIKVLPAPHMIVTRGFELLQQSTNYVLLSHIGYSLMRALIAFVFAVTFFSTASTFKFNVSVYISVNTGMPPL